MQGAFHASCCTWQQYPCNTHANHPPCNPRSPHATAGIHGGYHAELGLTRKGQQRTRAASSPGIGAGEVTRSYSGVNFLDMLFAASKVCRHRRQGDGCVWVSGREEEGCAALGREGRGAREGEELFWQGRRGRGGGAWRWTKEGKRGWGVAAAFDGTFGLGLRGHACIRLSRVLPMLPPPCCMLPKHTCMPMFTGYALHSAHSGGAGASACDSG